MKTMKKTIALLLGLCMLMSLASVSALAADYTPTTSYDRFFYGGSGAGFLQTTVNYDLNGDGVSGDNYYVAYGTNGYYTSIDGKKWDVRSSNLSISSLAYGNDMGIGVRGGTNKTAYIFDKEFYSNQMVYNKLKDRTDRWIELHPNIYFDEYSGLFFCHGFEYSAADASTYTDVGLYYTEGTLESVTYGNETATALVWTEVNGDFFWNSADTNGDDIATNSKNLKRANMCFDGDGAGTIWVSSHGNIGSSDHSNDARAFYSIITTTQDKNVTAKSDKHGFTMYINTTPNTVFFDGHVLALGFQSSQAVRYSAGEFDADGKISFTRSGNYPTNKSAGRYDFSAMYENDGTIYITSGMNIYKTSFDKETNVLADIDLVSEEINGETVQSYKSITEGIYNSLSYREGTVQSGEAIKETAANGDKVEDMLFLDDGSIVLMVNASGKTYLCLMTTENDATNITQLHADSTYTHFTGTDSETLTDTTAKGYRVDGKFRAWSGGVASATAGFTATISGEGSEYFSGATTAYTTVSENAPAGRYTINYFLKMTNQPSIFATKTAVYDVVPRFTTAVNGGDAADEVRTVQLNAGSNIVTVTLDDLEKYVYRSSSTTDATLGSSFLVIGARYDSSHRMQEVVKIYDKTKLTKGSATPYEFTVTNAAEGDYMKVFILEGFSTIKPLW